MLPRVPGGEDAQPNERRLNRKGATNVPMIRLTTPRRTGRGTFQGRQSHRGSGDTYTPHNPSHASNRSQLFRGRVNNAGQYASAYSHPGPSRHSTAPYPYAVNSATQNASKRSPSFSDVRQPKRPRFEAPSQSRLDQSTLSKHTKKQLPSRIEIKLDLPLYCRTGVHRYRASRRAWLDREVQRIELERKLKVYNTQYLDREVLLSCSAEESQDLPARGNSSVRREEQMSRFNTPDAEQRLLNEPSKEEDQIGDCAPTTVTNFTHQDPMHPIQAYASKAQPVNSLPKPTIPTKSNQPAAIQQSSSLDRPSSSQPLSKGSHTGRLSPLSNSDQAQPAAPRDSLLPPVHHSSVTRVSPSNTLVRSTTQHISPRLPSYAFRSGSLAIKSMALTARPTTQATSRDVSHLSLHKSPAPSPSQPNTMELRETWIDDSDSDIPLASTFVSRNPTCRANFKQREGDLAFVSSNSTRSAYNSRSSSPSGMQPSPVVNVETMRVPLDRHDRSRRILQSSKGSLIHATMHGFVNRVDLSPLRQRSVARTPASPAREQVDDVCLLQAFNHTIAILGHGRNEEQISLFSLDHDRKHVSCSLDRPWNRAKKGGVSVVCSMMQPLMFASGGYDHSVHLWTLKEDLSSASPSQLAIKHSSVVQSLVPIRDTGHKLVSASADNNVHIWDLSSERVVNTVKASNSVFHAHPTSSPFCILLEVAHRELQYELRDYRLVPETPVQRFGYETPQIHGRFIKGDVQSNEFVCGGRDGCIRLWDIRSYNGPFATMTCFPPAKVVQAAFDKSSGHILVGSASNDIARVKYI